MSLSYDEYLNEHITNVKKALNWMDEHLKEHIDKNAMRIAQDNVSRHDESKFNLHEYRAYDAYFYGGNRSWKVVCDFNIAWLLHQHINPHHWQYWVLINDDPEDALESNIKPLMMPLEYIYEMIADWWSFSWKNNNLFEIFSWYNAHAPYQIMHPDTRKIVNNILEQIWKILIMQETLANHDIDDITKQYALYWMREDHDDFFSHSGIKGQKWGVRNGPPYPLGGSEKLNSVKKLNDLMNNGWDYGVLDHGKHLLDTDDYEWDKNYRTTPIDVLEKEKIGTCWDFVNYQHDKLKNMGIKDNSYLITIQKSDKPDDIVTHTFTTFDLDDKKYWLESAAWPKRGVHEIKGLEDVAKELNDMYHNPGRGLSIFEYNPEGMDKGLTTHEFFEKASQNLVYDESPIVHSGIKGQKWGVRNGPPYPLDSENVSKKLYEEATNRSTKITNDIRDAAKRSGGYLHGLENQIKTEESIERKLNKKINEKDMSITEAAKSIKDALRYTVISDDDNFVNTYYDFKNTLSKRGYEETSCDNYFDKFNKGEVKHKAVQSNFATDDGYEFEVQFHTPESQDAKDKKVPIYNERRSSGLSEQRKQELERQMEELALNVPDPKDIETILSHSDLDEDDEHKYGVPELKKFPMPDRKHVKSAIKFFNYIDPKHEKELANAILERMEEYGMTFDDIGVGNENRFKKYIPAKIGDEKAKKDE